MGVKTLAYMFSVLVVSFVGGYFYGRAIPEVVYFKRDKLFQEVRDSYYHKCEEEGVVVRSDGVAEITWSCPKMKLFLIQRYQKEISQKRSVSSRNRSRHN